MRRAVPEFFCTTVRKVEPIGGDCIRVYHSTERGGVWEDIFTVVIPIASVLIAARFVVDCAHEIVHETRRADHLERVH